MRAWENRPDTVVVDEPLYAFYLAATGLDHPGRDEVIASQPTDWRTVVGAADRGAAAGGETIGYQKHMTHHVLPEVDLGALAPLRHAFLIRDPRRAARLLRQGARPSRPWPTWASPRRWRSSAGSAARWSTPPTCSRDPEGDAARALRGAGRALRRRRCCPGRPGRGTATACGRRTGTPASRPRPASRPTAPPAVPSCPRTWPRWPSSAALLRAAVTDCTPAGGADRCCSSSTSATATWSSTSTAASPTATRPAVSPFDSAVQGGDAVWEGLRLYHGRIFGLRRAPGPAAALGPALAFARDPHRRGDHRADPPHARRQRDDRRRAHPAHAHPRRQGHQRHGPAAQPERPDADRAGRAQAAGLRRRRHHAGHLERAPADPGLPRPEDPLTTTCSTRSWPRSRRTWPAPTTR